MIRISDAALRTLTLTKIKEEGLFKIRVFVINCSTLTLGVATRLVRRTATDTA